MGFSFSIDGVRSEDVGISVLDVRRGLLPPAQGRFISIPDMNGAYYHKSDFGMNSIEVEILVEEEGIVSLQSRIREIAGYLDPGKGLREIIFDDEADKYYMAVINGDSVLNQIRDFRRGTVEFVSPYPFAFSLNSVNQVLVPEQNNVNRVGSAAAPVVLTVNITNGSIPYFEFENANSGKRVIFEAYNTPDDMLVAGDVFVIDMGKNLVTRNGNSVMRRLWIDSQFWDLEEKSQMIALWVDTSGGNYSASMNYIPRWL